MPGLRFHDLRHTHITHAVEEGVPIEVVMAQVGHVSAEMTRYYTHLGGNARHAAVAAIQEEGSGRHGSAGASGFKRRQPTHRFTEPSRAGTLQPPTLAD
jgi:hypothetical protein